MAYKHMMKICSPSLIFKEIQVKVQKEQKEGWGYKVLSLCEAHVGVCARINDFLQYPIETKQRQKQVLKMWSIWSSVMFLGLQIVGHFQTQHRSFSKIEYVSLVLLLMTVTPDP